MMDDVVEAVQDVTQAPDMRMLRKEIEAAQRILDHPDRHTRAELEVAQERGAEAARIYFDHLNRNLSESLTAWSARFQETMRALARQMQPVWQEIGRRLNMIMDNDATANFSDEPRAKLRAAKRRARLSTQVRKRATPIR